MSWLRRWLPWLFLFVILLQPQVAMSKDVTLSWDASPTQSVVGYRVLISLLQDMSVTYQDINASNVLTLMIPDLEDTSAYWFCVKAYDHVGNESTCSNIVTSPAIPEDVLPKLEFEINVEVLK